MMPRNANLFLARWLFVLLAGFGSAVVVQAQLSITALSRQGGMNWIGAPAPGITAIQWAADPKGPWAFWETQFSTNGNGQASSLPPAPNVFLRLRGLDVPPTAQGFTNLVRSYGRLETLGGSGVGQLDTSYWQTWYEGWPGTWVALSRPHFAMADRSGRIYIADKNSHSVLRIDPDGTLHTHAGTHAGGFNGEGPAASTNLQLNLPNGLWVRADGTVYVLDTENGRVRRVSTSGVMTTLFWATSDASALSGGRGIWVAENETSAYFGNNTRLRRWTPALGVQTFVSGFVELGDFIVEANGSLVVCDRGAHYVYRVQPNGTRTILAGNGTATGGGDGFPGLQTGLNGVRGVWPVPTGGYLLLTHDGCQLWYLDAGGTVRLLLNGARGRTHSGDGLYFYTPETKISEGRSVTMDYAGNILICESDYGFIRRIRFESWW